jgi:hypothetical protein
MSPKGAELNLNSAASLEKNGIMQPVAKKSNRGRVK